MSSWLQTRGDVGASPQEALRPYGKTSERYAWRPEGIGYTPGVPGALWGGVAVGGEVRQQQVAHELADVEGQRAHERKLTVYDLHAA